MLPTTLGTYYESLLETEVRKEGGIYYTPPLIADYMVAESVGKLLNNKTPKEAKRIKIVVPSCGGDSLLLDWQKKLSCCFPARRLRHHR